MKGVMWAISLCLWLGYLTFSTQAQSSLEAYFDIRNTRPHIGERIEGVLVITYTEDIQILQRPRLPKRWGIFQVVSQEERQTVTTGGRIIEQQKFELVAWETGDHALPPVQILYRFSGQADIITYTIPTAYFSIPSVLQPDALFLRPYESPIAMPYLPEWLLLTGIGILPIALIAMRQLLVRYKRRRAQSASVMSPQETFLATLKALKGESVTYLAVSNALSDYLEARFGIPAHHQTTQEILGALQNSKRLRSYQIADLTEILEHLTLGKFSTLVAYPPQKIVVMLKTWVENTYSSQSEGAS